MNIVFMGNPSFALPALKRLHEDGRRISAVVTNPDRPAGRGRKLKTPEVKSLALQLNLEVLQPEKLSDEGFIDKLIKFKPELFVVVAFRILPKKLLEIPAKGSVNLHASILPKYRGAAPINWAIINGETETGVSTFYLKPKVDSGDILLQRKFPIAPETTYGELYDQLSRLGAEVLTETVRLREMDCAKPVGQDNIDVTAAPKITPEICRIDFNKICGKVVNLIMGLSPRPGAYTQFRGRKVKILRAERAEGICEKHPGTVEIDRAGKGGLVVCADGAVKILSIQIEGKKVMTGEEFINGYRPQDGEIMGDSAV